MQPAHYYVQISNYFHFELIPVTLPVKYRSAETFGKSGKRDGVSQATYERGRRFHDNLKFFNSNKLLRNHRPLLLLRPIIPGLCRFLHEI